MPETLRKVYDCETKKLDDYTFEFTASTEAIDRDGEVIEAKGWDLKNFKKNPVIMYGHDYRSLPIGRASKVWVSEGTLKNHVEFPPEGTYEFADIVRRLLEAGYLKTESVGFIPKEWEDGDGEKTPKRTYTKTELLEISIVPVPSNPDALLQAKSAGVITDKELELITKPYPQEHACRLRSPDDFQEDSFRRTQRDHEGKKYSVIMGRLKDETTMTEQAYRYDKDVWGAGEARTHCKDHDGAFEPASKEGIPQAREISQEELSDELDFVCDCIENVGLNPTSGTMAWNIVREVLRLQGNDMPLDIAEKVGAVLNQKNKDRLEQIQVLAQQILDSAQREEEPKDEKMAKPEITLDEIIRIVKGEVTKAISKAQGKLN